MAADGSMRTLIAVLSLATLPVGLSAQESPAELVSSDLIAQTVYPSWSVTDFVTIADMRSEDPLKPTYDIRFEASIQAKQDLFVSTKANLGPFEILSRSVQSGAVRKLYGTISYEYYGGDWLGFPKIENSPDFLGQPIDLFDNPSVALGSDRFTELSKQYDVLDQLNDSKQLSREVDRLTEELEASALAARESENRLTKALARQLLAENDTDIANQKLQAALSELATLKASLTSERDGSEEASLLFQNSRRDHALCEERASQAELMVEALNQSVGALRGQLGELQGLLDDAAVTQVEAVVRYESLAFELDAAVARANDEKEKRLQAEQRLRNLQCE